MKENSSDFFVLHIRKLEHVAALCANQDWEFDFMLRTYCFEWRKTKLKSYIYDIKTQKNGRNLCFLYAHDRI